MAGDACNPYFIFKGARMLQSWWQAVEAYMPDAGVHIGYSENGWTDNGHGLSWMKEVFDPCSRRGTDEYGPGPDKKRRLLILDGHESHHAYSFVQYAYENGIEILIVPPHSTHLLQPLVVGVFSPFQHWYSEGVDELSRIGHDTISKELYIRILANVREQTYVQPTVQNAFRATGLLTAESLLFAPRTDIPSELTDRQIVLKKLPNRETVSARPLLRTPERDLPFQPYSSPQHPPTPKTSAAIDRHVWAFSVAISPSRQARMLGQVAKYAKEEAERNHLLQAKNRELQYEVRHKKANPKKRQRAIGGNGRHLSFPDFLEIQEAKRLANEEQEKQKEQKALDRAAAQAEKARRQELKKQDRDRVACFRT